MNETEWLASLKSGDTVAVSGGLGGREMWLATVNRRTPSGRIIVMRRNAHGMIETVFNPDGRERGGTEHYEEQLLEPTPAICDMIEKKRLERKMAKVDWHSVPLETLRKVKELIG